jgi:hypothetical protein
MGIRRGLYRVGSTVAIFVVAAACSSAGGSQAPQHSPTTAATAASTATLQATATPTSTPVITDAPSDSPTETASSGGIDTPAPAPVGWKTYTDSAAGIRFAYPPTWAPATASGYPAVATTGNTNLVLWITQAAKGLTLDGYKPVDIASMEADPDNQGEVSIGGVAGWGAEWHVTRSGKDLYVVDCFTVRNDKTFDFMWMSTPGNEDADIALFQEIESTLVFTD